MSQDQDARLPEAGTPLTSASTMVRTLGGVALLCGVLIVSVYEATLKPIAANKQIALQRSVFKVIPGAVSMRVFRIGPRGLVPTDTAAQDSLPVYATYDETGQLMGVAAEASAMGYADQVRVLYAYDPGRQAIVGISVISMRETPGIGDKIITDPAFLKNFSALDVRLNSELKALANAVKVVKNGTKSQPWEIDAISGATVTSKAVGKGIHDSAQRLLPWLVPHLDALKSRS